MAWLQLAVSPPRLYVARMTSVTAKAPRRGWMAGTLAAVALAASGHGAQAHAAPLQVTVSNVHSMKGHVRVDLCTAQTFLGDCVLSAASPPAPGGETTVFFPDVPPGEYAIQAYQDENDDHEVNRNRFGIPTEGFGFSHDAAFSLGPPKWKHARFSIDDRGASVRVKLHYLPH